MSNWTDKNMKSVLDKASGRALRKIGIVIAGDASLRCARKTGRAAGSITYATKGDRSEAKNPAKSGDEVSRPAGEDTVHIGSNVEYASYVEYGTKNMGAQPFLRPAFDRNKKNAQKIFSREIKAALRGK